MEPLCREYFLEQLVRFIPMCKNTVSLMWGYLVDMEDSRFAVGSTILFHNPFDPTSDVTYWSIVSQIKHKELYLLKRLQSTREERCGHPDVSHMKTRVLKPQSWETPAQFLTYHYLQLSQMIRGEQILLCKPIHTHEWDLIRDKKRRPCSHSNGN